ncbi:HAD hydrolase-like protein [Pseudarthrobacter sp. J1738]|uniref:HAD hydrolase-like protein n=1 Tax=Pseudarthrobacter sp. J1738 TaxID=3420446 RepID=UPI003D282447
MTETMVPVIFDLDGTLVDPAGGITGGISSALASLGLPVPDQPQLDAMVGPKLSDALETIALVPKDLINEVILRYRAKYRSTGIAKSKVYPGVRELLEVLSASGRKVAVATQKPQTMAHLVLEHHGIDKYFLAIRGSSDDESASANSAPGKAEIVRAALAELESSAAVMVGDRYQDVVGASANGLDCIGVRWGFAPEGELEEAGVSAVVSTAEELRMKIEELDAVYRATLSEVSTNGAI